MIIPEKVFIPYDSDAEYLSDKYYIGQTPTMENAEYIRKGALIDWIKAQLKENEEFREICLDDRFFGEKEVAFNRIIDKINSL